MTQKNIFIAVTKLAFSGILIYFSLRYFAPRWESLQLSDRLRNLSLAWFAVATIIITTYYLLALLIWIMILRNLGSKPDLHMIARAYIFSLLPKYIPGNVAAHGIRTQLAARAGVPVVISIKSFLLEVTFALGTAAAISIPGTIYYYPAFISPRLTWPVSVVLLLLILVVARYRFKLRHQGMLDLRTLSRPKTYTIVFSLYLLFWFVFSVAHWCIANAITAYSASQLPQLTVAVSASWAIGFISFFAPAGLGVREAVLYFFVKNWMQQADVILFVTLSRLLMFGVEVFLTIGFLLYRKFAHRPEMAMIQ